MIQKETLVKCRVVLLLADISHGKPGTMSPGFHCLFHSIKKVPGTFFDHPWKKVPVPYYYMFSRASMRFSMGGCVLNITFIFPLMSLRGLTI